jgi:hypothetical protein
MEADERRLRPLLGALLIPLVVLLAVGAVGLRAKLASTGGAGADPVARTQPAMAFDAAHGVVVMFGGRWRGSPLGDTWTWDGDGWHQQHPAASPPPGFGEAMGFDPQSRWLVLVGGTAEGMQPRAADTWSWDGSTWHAEHPAHAPSSLLGAGTMATDPRTGELVLLAPRAGEPGPGGVLGGDGYAAPVPGAGFQPIPSAPGGGPAAPVTPHATPRGGPVVAPAPMPVPEPGITMGPVLTTWTWTGGDWVDHGAAPAGLLGPRGLAYDGSVQRLVLVDTQPGHCSASASASAPGSAARGDSPLPGSPPPPVLRTAPGPASCLPPMAQRWTWDGRIWSPAPPPSKNAPAPGSMVSLPDGSGLLVNGAGTTWTGRGADWTRIGLTPELSRRSGFGLVADPVHHVVLLFGGQAGTEPAGDTWTWDGSSWNHRSGSVPPAPTPFVPPSQSRECVVTGTTPLPQGGAVACGAP